MPLFNGIFSNSGGGGSGKFKFTETPYVVSAADEEFDYITTTLSLTENLIVFYDGVYVSRSSYVVNNPNAGDIQFLFDIYEGANINIIQ